MLNSHVISGLGMASAIQAGIKEYCGLLNTWKVDWKCTKPVSMVKEGLAACFGWHTDLGKIHDFFWKHVLVDWLHVMLRAQTPFSLGYAAEQHPESLWGQTEISLLLVAFPSVSPWLFVCEDRFPGFCVICLLGISRWSAVGERQEGSRTARLPLKLVALHWQGQSGLGRLQKETHHQSWTSQGVSGSRKPWVVWGGCYVTLSQHHIQLYPTSTNACSGQGACNSYWKLQTWILSPSLDKVPLFVHVLSYSTYLHHAVFSWQTCLPESYMLGMWRSIWRTVRYSDTATIQLYS